MKPETLKLETSRMILSIYAYGQPVLKKIAEDIDKDYPGLAQLIADMWETMYASEGVGLAAPQIGHSIRLFVMDSHKKPEDLKEGEVDKGIKRVCINAHRIDEFGKPFTFEEGCLSIPDIRGDVDRPDTIRLRYLDENFEEHEETFTELNARVVQHEYDHLEGILFTERLKPIKRQLIKRKLEKIREGRIKVEYKMKFVKK